MRAVIQRVLSASVVVDGQTVGEVGNGLLVLLGVEKEDNDQDLKYLAEKTIGLRIFNDVDGKMNRSIEDAGGEMLVVSQFTLLGDTRKGKRPSFIKAADPETGNRMYTEFVDFVRDKGIKCETGQFQADMKVHLINDGPVTILLDSRRTF
ncbi:MAG: D-aminoacyl-tRNA deacylase [Planctomycetota bacterium]